MYYLPLLLLSSALAPTCTALPTVQDTEVGVATMSTSTDLLDIHSLTPIHRDIDFFKLGYTEPTTVIARLEENGCNYQLCLAALAFIGGTCFLSFAFGMFGPFGFIMLVFCMWSPVVFTEGCSACVGFELDDLIGTPFSSRDIGSAILQISSD